MDIFDHSIIMLVLVYQKFVLIQLINKVNYNLCDNIKLGIYKLYDL